MIWPLASPDGAAKGGVPVAAAMNWRGRHAKWHGALAQLGERLHGMQEVSGSIPLGSTITKKARESGLFFLLLAVRIVGPMAALGWIPDPSPPRRRGPLSSYRKVA